jgi:hypothetical protein
MRRGNVIALCAALLAASPAISRAGEAGSEQKEIKSSIKTIYLVASSHWDLGWTDPVDVVFEKIKAHVDEIIEECLANPDLRWTMESPWQITEWMKRTPDPKRRQQLIDLIKERRVTVGAPFAAEAEAGPEGSIRNLYPFKRLKDEWGITSELVIWNDGLSATKHVLQAAAPSGLRYLLYGHHPSSGPETGRDILPWGPPWKFPFYWEGEDGSRLLTWPIAYTSSYAPYFLAAGGAKYMGMVPKELRDKPNEEVTEYGIRTQLQWWEKQGYPFDAILIIHAFDNSSPKSAVSLLRNEVAAWNRTYRSPKIVHALPEDFFRHIETKYPGQIPVLHKGNYNGIHLERPELRFAFDHLPVAEQLGVIGTLLGLEFFPKHYTPFYPAEDVREAYEKLFLVFGHGRSCYACTRASQEHAGWVTERTAQDAAEMAGYREQIGLEALVSKVAAENNSILVYNPLSWERKGPVSLRLSPQWTSQPFLLRDAQSGAEVPYQKVGADALEFIASAPPLGYRRYELHPGAPSLPPGSRVAPARQVESPYYRVSCSEAGSLSLWDKKAARKLAGEEDGFSFFGLARTAWALAWQNGPFEPVRLATPRVEVESGPVFSVLRLQRPGSAPGLVEIKLYHALPLLDASAALDPDLIPVDRPAPEFRYGDLTFPGRWHHTLTTPWSLKPAQASVRLESQNPTGHGLELAGPDGFALRAVSRSPQQPAQLPQALSSLVQAWPLPRTDDLQIAHAPPPALPAWRTTESRIEIALTSASGGADPLATSRFGYEWTIPLRALPRPAGSQGPLAAPAMSFFHLDAPNVFLNALKLADFGDRSDLILRLQEVAGKETPFRLLTVFPVARATRNNPVEEEVPGGELAINPVQLTLRPHEIATVRLRLQREPGGRPPFTDQPSW